MMSPKTVIAVVVLLFAIHTVNVESQENKVEQGNPPDADVVKTDIGQTAVQSVVTEPDPATNTVVKTKPAPRRQPGRKRKPTNRRRQRKRRPRKPNAGKQNGTAGGKVNIPSVESKPELKNKAKSVIKPEAVSNGKNGKKNKKKPKPMDMSFDMSFFDLDPETTPTPVDPNAPPPEFTVNGPPREKIMPTLGPYKDAYDGTPCNETYRPHNAMKTKYEMKYADGSWHAVGCPPNLGSGLVWRQDQCACGEEVIPYDPDDGCGNMGYNSHPTMKHKYTRNIHGVDALMDCPGSLIWSQKTCHCIFDPDMKKRPIENRVTFTCKTILQLEFEGDLKNTAVGYQVETVDLRRRGKLPRIRFRQIPGSTNKAAMIVSQPLKFLAFRGNDFQRHVTYALAFKISPRHETKTNPMILITDECIGNPGQQKAARKPSIAFSFVPNTRTFRLQFRTEQTEIDQYIEGGDPIFQRVITQSKGWYKVVIYFEDQTVNLESNGKLLFTQKDVLGKVPQNKCPLYIAGRGRGFDRSMDFYGYLDSIYLVKDCKFHEANIKFL